MPSDCNAGSFVILQCLRVFFNRNSPFCYCQGLLYMHLHKHCGSDRWDRALWSIAQKECCIGIGRECAESIDRQAPASNAGIQAWHE